MIQTHIMRHLAIAKNISRNPKFWVIWATDIVLLMLALYFSYRLRFEGNLLETEQIALYTITLPIIFLVKIPVFYVFGLYRGMWRYTSTRDLANIIKATLVSSVLIVAILLYINRFEGLSRSVFILDAIFTFLFISGHRVAIRYFYTGSNGPRRFSFMPSHSLKKRLLLIGAGDAAEKILRELQTNPNLPYLPIGLVDDDPQKTGLKIHGVPVVGLVEDLADHIERTSAGEVLISIASASSTQMKRFVDLCQSTKIPFKVIPGLGEIIDGKVSIKASREISYKDLLGRDEVVLDQNKIDSYITGKTILVTGAGGSIGSELCRQILRFSPGRLILFDSSEENLYAIQMQLIHELGTLDAVAVLGKVQDVRLLDLVFRNHRPEVVFHAAAYKHVPLVERNPWQAVNNNIFAAQLVIEAAILYRVERFVLVSTDKAVRPTNVMGASKRLTELLLQAYDMSSWDRKFSNAWQKVQLQREQSSFFTDQFPTHSTRFMAVRFGNVIGSSGSVIPLFKRQIERGGPVTVTHPEITRYFMSIVEAAQLILQAGSMGEGAEIFILKMGQPIKIDHMARELIRLAGKDPDNEIEIKYTGLREGEKLFEELITDGEGIVDTYHEKIMVLRGDSCISCTTFHGYLEKLAEGARAHNGRAIKETLKEIIPEYHPDNDSRSVGNNMAFESEPISQRLA
jgi:FlaA1/EpsC-like NDP-sugar epimerase